MSLITGFRARQPRTRDGERAPAPTAAEVAAAARAALDPPGDRVEAEDAFAALLRARLCRSGVSLAVWAAGLDLDPDELADVICHEARPPRALLAAAAAWGAA